MDIICAPFWEAPLSLSLGPLGFQGFPVVSMPPLGWGNQGVVSVRAWKSLSLSIQPIPLELSMGAELRGPCPWVLKDHLGVSTRDPHIHPPICLHPHLSLGNYFLVLVVDRKDTILPQPLLLQYCI